MAHYSWVDLSILLKRFSENPCVFNICLLLVFINKCAALDLRECIQKGPILAFLCAFHTAIYVAV